MSLAYGALVSQRHISSVSGQVCSDTIFGYDSTYSARSGLQSRYNVDEYAKVSNAIDFNYGSNVSGVMESAYDDSAIVKSSHIAASLSALVVNAGHIASSEDTARVVYSHIASSEVTSSVVASMVASSEDTTVIKEQVSSRYGDVVEVRGYVPFPYDISDREYVRSIMAAYYSSQGDSIRTYEGVQAYITLASGHVIGYESLDVSCSEGDYVWRCDATISRVDEFILVNKRDPFTITIGGEDFLFIVDSKSIDRSDVTDIVLRMSGFSPAIQLSGPYNSKSYYTETTAKTAHELVEFVLGTTVDWQVHNGVIPPYRYSYSNLYPIEAAKLIVSAIRGMLESLPDGSLLVRYEFPVTATALDTATPDIVLTDMDDNLSVSDSFAVGDVRNRFRVRDSAPVVSDMLEFIATDGFSDRGVVKAYPYPWRTTVHVEHTDGAVVSLQYVGIVRRTEKQVIEIKDGAGKLTYPCVGIISVRWMSDVLTGLHVEPRTTDVYVTDLTTNFGYGLVEITYYVDSINYNLQFPTGTSAQLLLVDG